MLLAADIALQDGGGNVHRHIGHIVLDLVHGALLFQRDLRLSALHGLRRLVLRVAEDLLLTELGTAVGVAAQRLALGVGLLQAFSGASQELRNFLCLLCDRRALWQLPACLTAYEAAYDEAHGILRATAITAVPMQQRQREALCARLESLTGKTVSLTCRTDPTLLGGITLRYGGIQLDDSIRSRLERLRRSLSQTVV